MAFRVAGGAQRDAIPVAGGVRARALSQVHAQACDARDPPVTPSRGGRWQWALVAGLRKGLARARRWMPGPPRRDPVPARRLPGLARLAWARLPAPRTGVAAAIALGCLLAQLPATAQNTGPARLASALESAGYAAVPMTRHGDAHLTIELRINDVPGTFILDTGAGRTVIDRAAQARFSDGREVVAGGVATGAGGSGLALASLPDSRLRIGAYRDESFTVHFLALDHVNAAFSQRGQAPVDGVIGADVLVRGGAVIDYPNMRLYLRNPHTRGSAAASSSPSSSGQR